MKNKNIIFTILTLTMTFLSLVVILLTFKSLPPDIPLFYSLPWGEGQLTNKVFLFAIPISTFLIFTFNLVFLRVFKIEKTEDNERTLEYINEALVFVSFLVSLINLITVVKIVRLFI